MTSYAKKRMSNPMRYFETPDRVLNDSKLSRFEKRKILTSMADDAEQRVEATSEGMAGVSSAFNAKELQSALKQLEKIKKVKPAVAANKPNARFQRIMVVTTINQDLNRVIANTAFDLAKNTGGKVHLLNVVPTAIETAGLVTAGPMGCAAPHVTADDTKLIKTRNEQLAQLHVECGTDVKTKIEVRSGQIEQEIIEYADDCDADLIVVGSPNRSWLESLFEISVPHSITKSAPCPVLVVPEQS